MRRAVESDKERYSHKTNMNSGIHKIQVVFFLSVIAFILAGCASNMNEADKFLWNSDTNAPAAKP